MKFSLWYLPAPDEMAWMEETIRRLAAEHGTQRFVPHVTGYSGETDDPATLVENFITLIGNKHAFSLSVRSVGSGDSFHHCVFLELETNPIMQALIEDLSKVSTISPSYRLDPHLSLLYGNLSNEVARNQASLIVEPPERICLHRVQLVHPKGNNGWFDMDDLEIWTELPLSRSQ